MRSGPSFWFRMQIIGCGGKCSPPKGQCVMSIMRHALAVDSIDSSSPGGLTARTGGDAGRPLWAMIGNGLGRVVMWVTRERDIGPRAERDRARDPARSLPDLLIGEGRRCLRVPGWERSGRSQRPCGLWSSDGCWPGNLPCPRSSAQDPCRRVLCCPRPRNTPRTAASSGRKCTPRDGDEPAARTITD